MERFAAVTMKVFWILPLVVSGCMGYIPGMVAQNYESGAPLAVYANKLQSASNKLPHQYHYAYPFCRPGSKTAMQKSMKLNLGQLLLGERHEFTNFDFNMGVDEQCKLLCRGEVGRNMTGPLQRLNSELVLKLMQRLIDDGYVVRLNVDNLPVVMRSRLSDGSDRLYIGYPFGLKVDDRFYVHNHFRFTVLVHEPKEGTLSPELLQGVPDRRLFRVVGFEVQPWSLKNNKNGTCDIGSPEEPAELQPLDTEPITFTYDVTFKESSMIWATRWDPLFDSQADQSEIQWFSIINSILLTFFLTLIVGIILLKTVRNDFVRYNRLEDEAEMLDESGWKLVHGDVFRTPVHAELLSIMCGTGAQLLTTFFTTLFLAIFGFFSPSYRGGLLTSLLFLWVFLSGVSGYVSASMYNNFGGQHRRAVSLGSSFLFTGLAFSMFLLLNLLLWSKKSTGAVPFFAMISIIAMWFGLSVPLVLFGAYIGFRQKPREWPCRTNPLPREIPASLLQQTSQYHCILTGLVPFGVVFMQLIFVLNSLWQNQLYYMFRFLFIVFILVLVASAEVSIAFTYLKLTAEDYNWWWYSFKNTAFTSFYVLFYCFFFFFYQTHIDWWSHLSSSILFMSYAAMVSTAFGLVVGYIGLIASLAFVRRIYSSIRID